MHASAPDGTEYPLRMIKSPAHALCLQRFREGLAKVA
jgi:hypothetical protein